MSAMTSFMPHGSCFLWRPDVLTLHVVSDSLIALAYFCIPPLMWRFVRNRRVLWPLSGFFSAFIIACGITHVFDVWTIWHADYWVAGGLKALCALASIGTAFAFLPLMPYARALGKLRDIDKHNGELEAQYRRVVETTSEGVWLLDAQAQTTLVNARMAEMLGYTPAELVGRPIYDFMCVAAVPSERLAFSQHATLDSAQSDLCFERRDGTQLWGELHFNAIHDAAGNFAGALAMVVDTSERRRAQIALEAKELRYRSLTEAMPQMIWTADADGSVHYWNYSWHEYTGTTFAGPSQAVWQAVIHAHDLPRFQEAWAYSLRTGKLHEIEYRVLRANDGMYRWHIGRVTPTRDAADAIEQWIGSCTDIHDYKVASETREILDTIGHIVFICTEDGSTVYASPHWSRYTGVSAESVLGYRWRSFVHPDDLEAIDARTSEGREYDLDALQYEMRVRGYDGEYRWFLARTAALPGASGSQRRWLKTLTDIEELKRTQSALAHDVEESKMAEAMLGTLHDAALAAVDAKSRFLATMSHEIRTPMNGIVGMAELLLLTKLNEEQRECSRVIRDSSRSLLRVLNDILDFSKIDAGKLDLELVDFQLRHQVDSVVSLLGPQFQEKNVALDVRFDSLIPQYVLGDPGRIRQVLLNLVGNALKFTAADGRVVIRVDRAPGAEGTVPIWFTIEDSGIGIEPDVIERLFTPFSQADGSTTRRFGGTGLGLSISAQLVALMDGIIGVQSQIGKGSSFWCLVPFKPAIGQDETQPVAEPAALDFTTRRVQRHEKILVVEDNEINVLVARKQFAQLGFSITDVGNGREAVEAVARERFDLVFMDCQMPEMDGFEATTIIRRHETDTLGHVPIIAMTADARDEDHQRCLRAGMDDYISKPTSLRNLQTVIDRWIAAPSALKSKIIQRRRAAGHTR